MFPAAVLRVSVACLLLGACGPSQTANRARPAVAVATPGEPTPTPPPVAGPATPAPPKPDAGSMMAPAVDAARPVVTPPPRPDAAPPPDLAVAPEVLPPPDAAADLAPPDAPPAPFATVTFAAAPTSIDLTAAQAIDWVHYGYRDSQAVNRKRGAAPLITMMPVDGASLDHYADRPVRFSWSDGAPVDRASDVNDGVNVGESPRHGFQLRVQGNPARPRTLDLYVGAWRARARLEVRLQRDGMRATPLFMDDSLMADAPGKDRVYRIVFQPAAGETLVVTWLLESMSAEYGNVTLQAAVLAE
jgi:hypothetical protein